MQVSSDKAQSVEKNPDLKGLYHTDEKPKLNSLGCISKF